MNNRGVSTTQRFLYLNLYAFLLLFGGVGILVVPLNTFGWGGLATQATIFLVCERYAIKMLLSWGNKKRKYSLLMERNSDEFRPDTFHEFMQAPCGVLLTKVVLEDLGESARFKELQKYRVPLSQLIKEGCVKQRTTIKIYNSH